MVHLRREMARMQLDMLRMNRDLKVGHGHFKVPGAEADLSGTNQAGDAAFIAEAG
jgi:hypothetical protein